MQKKHIRLGYILAGIFAVYFAFVAGKLIYAKRLSETAKFDHREVVLGEGQPLRYVAAGDSAAYGTGATSLEKTFTYQIAEELAKNYEVHHINAAKVGAKTNDLLNKQLATIIAYRPDLIVISITSNDAMYLRPNETTLKNYRKVLDELTSKTSAKIYITGPASFTGIKLFPRLYQYLIEKRAERLNETIMSLGVDQSRIHILDVYSKGKLTSDLADQALSKDRLHASDFGHTLWRDAFLEEISERR